MNHLEPIKVKNHINVVFIIGFLFLIFSAFVGALILNLFDRLYTTFAFLIALFIYFSFLIIYLKRNQSSYLFIVDENGFDYVGEKLIKWEDIEKFEIRKEVKRGNSATAELQYLIIHLKDYSKVSIDILYADVNNDDLMKRLNQLHSAYSIST
jgi:hypothetical protein